ncbi:MAG: hypothetical protein HZB62_09075 [Nitrospirae bacterium]|nr:hypothetical protein [Nitrospirota bacterium]
MKKNGHKMATQSSSRVSINMVMIIVLSFASLIGLYSAGISEAVTYNMQSGTGANLNGFTTNYGTCGTNATTEVIVPMNTSGSNACTTGRTGSTGAVGTSLLLVISDTPYSQNTNITGVDVTGSLRDYQEAINPGTLTGIQYQLGYVSGGVFTSFGSVNEVRDYSTNTVWTTSLSSISGTAPSGSRLAIRVFKQNPNTTEYRYYFTAASLVLNVTEAAGGTPGSLQLSASDYGVNENVGNVTITVTRTGGSSGAASVNYATSNGTAVQPGDYTSASGTLNWADGDAADKTFTVTIINDVTVESSETVNLTLSGATGASLGSPSTATITISDNDGAAAVPIGNWPLIIMVMVSMITYGVIWRRKQRRTTT